MSGSTTDTPDLSQIDVLKLAAALQNMQAQPPPAPQQQDLEATRPGLLGRIGEALAGGPASDYPMTAQQRDIAGQRALWDASVAMMGTGPFQTLGQGLAGGLQAARRSQLQSEAGAAGLQEAAQDYQQQQFTNRAEAIKSAVELQNLAIQLQRLKMAGAMPNLLAGQQPTGAGTVPTGPVVPGSTVAAAVAKAGGDPYAATIAGGEGLGKNPRSSASGYGGFIEGTWGDFAKANPDLFKGMTPEQVLAARNDPAIAAKAITWLAQQNAGELTKAGVTPSGQSLGISHYVGAKPAAQIMGAPDSDPVSKYVGDAAVKANPELGTMTVGQMKARYAGMPNPAFLGGTPSPSPAQPATAAPAAPAISTGPNAPAPPGGAPEAGAGAYPSAGAGIGRVLTGTEGVPGSQQYSVAPPPVIAPVTVPASKTGTDALKRAKTADAVDAIQAGRALAAVTPVPPGTVQAAGPAAGTPPAAASPVAEAGWGAQPGNYNIGPTGVQPPTAPAPTTTAPVAPTPQTPTQQPTDTRPDSDLSFPEFRQRHGYEPSAAERATFTLPQDQEAAARAQAELGTAAQNLQTARLYGTPADQIKAQEAYTTAGDKLAQLQQQLTIKNAEGEAKWRANQDTLLGQQYLKAKELAAAPALEAQRGQQAIELEKVRAGQTFHQKLEEQAAEYAQANTLKPMSEQAAKAHMMNLGLAQLQPILRDLPPGGGPLGAVLDAHPDLAPLFNTAGILNDRQADAVRLVNGLVSNISTQMKPTGLGALREYEWDAFKAQLPNLLSTPGGQQKALALLMNMNDRIQSENSWMNNYFSRRIPDETTPGATRPAHNLETQGAESVQQRMDRELGPIVPRYTGPMTGSGQAQWEASLPPGKPYYKTWAVPDPKNPGQPMRDSNGNIKTTTTLEVRPWQ